MGSRYLLNKIIQAIGTIFFIVILNFVLFRMMPGSPDRVLLRNPNVTTEVRDAARVRWGLDDPVPGPVASSTSRRRSRATSATPSSTRACPSPRSWRSRLWPTLILFGLGEVIAIVVGLALGAYSGWKRGGPVDYLGNGTSLVLYSMPYFVIGMFMLGIFATRPGLVPDVRDVRARDAIRRPSGSSSAISPGTWSCR